MVDPKILHRVGVSGAPPPGSPPRPDRLVAVGGFVVVLLQLFLSFSFCHGQHVTPDGVISEKCRSDKVAFRTCVTDKSGKNETTREPTEEGTPPTATDGFVIFNTALALAFLTDFSIDDLSPLSGQEGRLFCFRRSSQRTDLQTVLLQYLVEAMLVEGQQHILCLDIVDADTTRVTTNNFGDDQPPLLLAATTSLVISVSWEWHGNHVEQLQDTLPKKNQCHVTHLMECCLQEQITGRVLASCDHCDVSSCVSALPPFQGDGGRRHYRRSLQNFFNTTTNNCTASAGLVSFLQCTSSAPSSSPAVARVWETLDTVETVLSSREEALNNNTVVAECLALRQAIRALGDNRDNLASCTAFDQRRCGYMPDIGNITDIRCLCAPPPPQTSTLLRASTNATLCTIELDANASGFDVYPSHSGGLEALTHGTDGLYYAVGQTQTAGNEGESRLYVLNITAEFTTTDENDVNVTHNEDHVSCSLTVLRECPLPGRRVEAITMAPPDRKTGNPNLYIGGVAMNTPGTGLATPFVSRIDTACLDAADNNGHFVQDFTLEDANLVMAMSPTLSPPFFVGLTLEPLLQEELWAISSKSLYPPAPNSTRQGQYFFTRFNTNTGQANAEFKYFADSRNNNNDTTLMDVLALDDYGSFITIERGDIPQHVADDKIITVPPAMTVPPSNAPTPFSSEVPSSMPTSFPTNSDMPTSFSSLEPSLEATHTPTVIPTPPPRRGTCFYRAYVQELFLSMGVARKDLVQCVEGDFYQSVARGYGTIFPDIDERLGQATGQQQRRRRAFPTRTSIPKAAAKRASPSRHLEAEQPKEINEECIDVNKNARFVVLEQPNDHESQFADITNFAKAEEHYFICTECTHQLGDVIDNFKLNWTNAENRIENNLIRRINIRKNKALQMSDRFVSVVDDASLVQVQHRCGGLNRRLHKFDRRVDKCDARPPPLKNVFDHDNPKICPATTADIDDWHGRSAKIQLCCKK